jgi:hypothetical protein
MPVDATLLTKEEIQDEADERTTLALVISEGESKRQRNLMSVEEQTWYTRDLTSHLYWEDGNKTVRNIRK